MLDVILFWQASQGRNREDYAVIIIYSKRAYQSEYRVTPLRPRYITQQKLAEWAGTFAANDYTSVWLVPGTGVDFD